MSRYFLTMTASAALAASACVSSSHTTCDARTVAVGWSSFLLANDTPVSCATATNCASACTGAGVNLVDVFMDDNQVVNPATGSNGHFNCSDGGVNVTGVLNNGDHLFTVEALDSTSGAIALRAEATVQNSNCANVLQDTQPSEGTFELDFSFTPNQCTSATSSYIWFTLRDNIANQTIAFDGSHTPQAWTCGDGTITPVPISFALPTGTLSSGAYTLQRTEEVLYTSPTTPTQQAGNCNATDFDITAASRTQVNVPLTDLVTCF